MKNGTKSKLMLGAAVAFAGMVAAAAPNPAFAQAKNPCAPKAAANPCAPKAAANPCAPKAAEKKKEASNPCAPKAAANPCAPKR